MGLVYDVNQTQKMQKRQSLIIWLYQSRDQYKLRHYGDIVYFSAKNKYVMMYVEAEKKDSIIQELENKKFVKHVELSRHDELDFSDEHEEKLMSKLKLEAEKLQEENEEYRV